MFPLLSKIAEILSNISKVTSTANVERKFSICEILSESKRKGDTTDEFLIMRRMLNTNNIILNEMNKDGLRKLNKILRKIEFKIAFI